MLQCYLHEPSTLNFIEHEMLQTLHHLIYHINVGGLKKMQRKITIPPAIVKCNANIFFFFWPSLLDLNLQINFSFEPFKSFICILLSFLNPPQ